MPDENKFYNDTSTLALRIHARKETVACPLCRAPTVITRLYPRSALTDRPSVCYSGYCAECDVEIETSILIGRTLGHV